MNHYPSIRTLAAEPSVSRWSSPGLGPSSSTHANGGVTHVGVALTFGLVVMAMIYAVRNISGAHLNPAVTLGFALARRFEARRVPGYLAAQGVGALAASGLLRLLFLVDGRKRPP